MLEKYNEQCFQQESLLYVATHLLLNLAEDTRVQIKMKNKGIVGNLIELLDRDNVEFLILIVNFLKKLSIFAENKDEMKQADVVQKLVRLVQSPHDALVAVSLGLLLNLSFDEDIRTRIIELDLVPRLAELVRSLVSIVSLMLKTYPASWGSGRESRITSALHAWYFVSLVHGTLCAACALQKRSPGATARPRSTNGARRLVGEFGS